MATTESENRRERALNQAVSLYKVVYVETEKPKFDDLVVTAATKLESFLKGGGQ